MANTPNGNQHGIELRVVLGVNDGDSKKNLNLQISELQKKLDEVKIDIKIDPKAISALDNLAKMDFSKLTQSISGLQDGLKNAGKTASETANTTKKDFKDASKDIDKAFGHLGKNLQVAMKKGITDLDGLKQAFKGMEASFNMDYEVITKDGEQTAQRRITAITATYKNLEGQIEKVKLKNNSLVDIGDGRGVPMWLPDGKSKVVDKQMSDIAKMTEKAQADLNKLRASGDLTEQQFVQLSNRIAKIDQTNSFAILNQRVAETVKHNKDVNVTLREREQIEKRLIANQQAIQKQILAVEKTMKTNPRTVDKNEANSLLESYQRLNPAAKNFKESLFETNTQFTRMKTTASEAGREQLGIINMFKQAMEKFPIWINC